MKFKINKNTPTGQKITQLYINMQAYNIQACDLAEELGGGPSIATGGSSLGGGFIGVHFAECPKNWKLSYRTDDGNYYFPKAIKANRELINRIQALPTVSYHSLNEIVGFKGFQFVGQKIINRVGMVFGREFYLLSLYEGVDFTPNADMVELTYSEYKRLKEEIIGPEEEVES
ncbi:hypothetical protein GCM10028807_62870 [Spirosoma daeguense]